MYCKGLLVVAIVAVALLQTICAEPCLGQTTCCSTTPVTTCTTHPGFGYGFGAGHWGLGGYGGYGGYAGYGGYGGCGGYPGYGGLWGYGAGYPGYGAGYYGYGTGYGYGSGYGCGGCGHWW